MTYNLNISDRKLTISHEGLKDIVVEFSTSELTVWQDTDRYLVVAPGGGHWETGAPGGVSDHPGGFETEAGHILVHNL